MPVVKDHKSTIATDPLRNFKYLVQIHGSSAPDAPPFLEMGFMGCSGLNATTEIIPYREGGNNTSTRKMPGQTNYSDITLTNGVVVGQRQAWSWFREIFHVIQGAGYAAPGREFRRRMSIHILDHPVNDRVNQPTKVLFEVYKAWPSGLAYSDLDAGGNAVFVQQLVLAHEGWNMAWADSVGPSSVENQAGR